MVNRTCSSVASNPISRFIRIPNIIPQNHGVKPPYTTAQIFRLAVWLARCSIGSSHRPVIRLQPLKDPKPVYRWQHLQNMQPFGCPHSYVPKVKAEHVVHRAVLTFRILADSRNKGGCSDVGKVPLRFHMKWLNIIFVAGAP